MLFGIFSNAFGFRAYTKQEKNKIQFLSTAYTKDVFLEIIVKWNYKC